MKSSQSKQGAFEDQPNTRSRDPGEFLTTLWGNPPKSEILIWMLPQKLSKWYSRFDHLNEDMAAYPERDVYTGVGYPAPGTTKLISNIRGEAVDIGAIPGMWADIDVIHPIHKKPNLPPTREQALATLAKTPFEPTIIIDSGHGIQAWWLFDKPWIFEDQEADNREAQKLAQWWNREVKSLYAAEGWDIDSVFDLARVLRVPGTFNNKDPEHRAPVTTIKDDGPRYNRLQFLEKVPADFRPTLSVNRSRLSNEVNGHDFLMSPDAEPPHEKLMALLDVDPKFRTTWMGDRSDLKDQSPSAFDMSLASMAAHAEWTDQEIADLLIAKRRKHGQDLKMRIDYYERTIANARSSSVIPDDATGEAEVERAFPNPGCDAHPQVGTLEHLTEQFSNVGVEDHKPRVIRPPDVEDFNEGAGWICKWPELKVTVQVSMITSATAKVEILLDLPGYVSKPLSASGFKLQDFRERDSTARILERRKDEIPDYPWAQVLDLVAEAVAARTLDNHEWIHVSKTPPTTPPGLLITPLIEKNQHHVIFGDGGTAKTWAALCHAWAAASGKTMAGFICPESQVPVLYLDYEGDYATFHKRCQMISAGTGQPIPDGLHYRKMVTPLINCWEEIRAFRLKVQAELVTVDSAAYGCTDAQKDEPVRAYYTALWQIGGTSLTIAHVTKQGASRRINSGEKPRPFGSVFWRNSSRATYLINAEKQGRLVTAQSLECIKENNTGKEGETWGISYTFSEDGNSVLVAEGRAASVGEAARTKWLAEKPGSKVAEVLKKKSPLTIAQLAQEVGVSNTTVSRALAELKAKSIVVEVSATRGKIPARFGLLARESR